MWTDRKDIGKGILHELEYPENMFQYFTKDIFRISEPAQLRDTLDNALKRCTEGRPGPVLVSVPYSFLDREIPYSPYNEPQPPGTASHPGLGRFLDACSDILKNKLKPVLIGGKGLMHPRAGAVVEEICAQGIPFLTSTGGKGTVSDRAIFSFGNIIAKGVSRDILDAADIVIAAGTRLRDVDAKRRGVKIRDLIHIDVDERWVNKNYPAAAYLREMWNWPLRGFLQLCATGFTTGISLP